MPDDKPTLPIPGNNFAKYLRPDKFDIEPGSVGADAKWTHWLYTFENFLDAEASPEDNEDYAIANVSCHYDSPRDSPRVQGPPLDHNYDTRDEPPAFFIHNIGPNRSSGGGHPYMEVSPKLTVGPGGQLVNVIHVGESQAQTQQPGLYNMSKRVRRSENVLRQAAECVSRGSTFQTVSEQFNIPISTIRFFMARKGILPRRRRGRSAQNLSRSCSSPEPPFHMQHFKLPDMISMTSDGDDTNNS